MRYAHEAMTMVVPLLWNPLWGEIPFRFLKSVKKCKACSEQPTGARPGPVVLPSSNLSMANWSSSARLGIRLRSLLEESTSWSASSVSRAVPRARRSRDSASGRADCSYARVCALRAASITPTLACAQT